MSNKIPDKGVCELDLSQELVVIQANDESTFNKETEYALPNYVDNQNYQNCQNNKNNQNEYIQIAQRQTNINAMAQDVHQLKEIFHDLGTMVDQQEMPIAKIQDHVKVAQQNVDVAQVQLLHAASLQKTAGLKMGLLATCIGGPVVGLAMGIKFGCLTSLFAGSGTYFYNRFL